MENKIFNIDDYCSYCYFWNQLPCPKRHTQYCFICLAPHRIYSYRHYYCCIIYIKHKRTERQAPWGNSARKYTSFRPHRQHISEKSGTHSAQPALKPSALRKAHTPLPGCNRQTAIAIRPISPLSTGRFRLQNMPFCNAKWAVLPTR